jgi:hypothetical protein
MAYDVLDGQINRMRKPGTLKSTVTSVVPAGQFLKRSAGQDEYDVIGATPPAAAFLNLVGTDRPDCTEGGIAVIGGESYELETDVYDSTATFVLDEEVSMKSVNDSVSGVPSPSGSGEYIHGIVTQVPASGNGNKLRILVAAINLGKLA